MSRPVPQIIARLRADTNVTDIAGQRIFAEHPPQDDVLPIVVINVENVRGFSDNVAMCHQKVYVASINVDIICHTRGQSEDLQEAVEDSLIGWVSSDLGYPINGITSDEGASWQLIDPKDGSDERGYWCEQTYSVTYQRI